MTYSPNDIVKSCRRLESGLRLGPEGLRACQLGSFAAPVFWSAEETAQLDITKEMIIEKRRWLFEMLNDEHSDITCKGCQMVQKKCYSDVNLTKLGQIDLAATTTCNLRCKFCGFVKDNEFSKSKYDALAILRKFSEKDIEWDSVVDFNGGEPSLLSNLDDFLDYFVSRCIRVRYMTNSVVFQQSIYEGLANGSIQWLCTSVDAGTPSTFFKLKKRDCFLKVLENLTRYAHAGHQDGGRLAMKYIFCRDNCSDDDIIGFVYAVLAIQPHQVWLTFDFSVLGGLAANSHDLGTYDPSKDIAAYAKMYSLLVKNGINVVHYTIGHLAAVCLQGQTLMEKVMQKIEEVMSSDNSTPILQGFIKDDDHIGPKPALFSTDPLCLMPVEQEQQSWSVAGKRILLAPACPLSIALLNDTDIGKDNIIGFLDRDCIIQGKTIQDKTIYGYDKIAELAPDLIMIAVPGQHREDIVREITQYTNEDEEIVIYNPR